MRVYTGIANKSPVYRPPAPAAAAPYGNAATKQHFGDVYRSQAQQAAVDMDRANTQMAADYYGKAQQEQSQSVLSGLNLLNTQRNNAAQRQNAQRDMAYGWLNDVTGMLGGLL